MIRKIFILTIVLWCSLGPITQVQASDVKDFYYENPVDKQTFDDEKWEAAIGEIDYTPPAIKKKQEEEAAANNNQNTATTTPNRRNRRARRNQGNWDLDIGQGIWSGFFKLILIILGIGLIAMLIFRLAGGSFEIAAPEKNINPRGIATSVDIKRVEQNLHKSDMEILIDKSLAEGNYMLTVRLYYLWAIKELSNKRLIKWKRDKTNRDYMREMRKTELHKPFREVTRIFERVWYGSQNQLNQSDYSAIQKKLDDFIKEVKKR